MKAAGQEMPIEVEAQSLEQVDEALAAGADIILLDNLSIEDIREAVRRIAGRAKIEISGGVTLERHARAGGDRRRLRVGRRADALGAGGRSELRARAGCLIPFPPELEAALQSSAARRGRLGVAIHYFTETGSTNDVAAALADGGSPEGTTRRRVGADRRSRPARPTMAFPAGRRSLRFAHRPEPERGARF